jgi:hypothetical protein
MSVLYRAGGHEQLISNSVCFKPAFAKRDKKQTMIDLRGIATNWFKNQQRPSIKLSRLWFQYLLPPLCSDLPKKSPELHLTNLSPENFSCIFLFMV